MIFNPFRKDPYAQAAGAAYNIIVAQSRHPDFYLSYGVEDNVTGRFDMIALHMTFVFHKLHTGGDEEKKFAQTLFDLFFKDMDRSLREMGVGDITVPKKVKKMGEVFYGLLGAVKENYDNKDLEGLSVALNRNLFNEEKDGSARQLAQYSIGQISNLEDQAEIAKGTLQFMTPQDAFDGAKA